ncbi:hypothetical protein HN460_03500 [bacterium]|jgi:hypothetical protein|nr:hypothetical protein [bacterium]MBT3795741.1 hypothetical protein [bacterium]
MTIFKLHSRIEKKDLEREHAKRYGRHKGYKKGSFQLGWKIQPRTPVQGRVRYKWGNLKDFYPPNLANPLTCRIPSLIDYLETRQPKYFFYTLEDWDFKSDDKFPVEKELVCKAIMYWRLMLFTGEIQGQEAKIVQYYLNTVSKIISSRMPIFGYWPYRNGLVHYYSHKKQSKLTFNPDVPSLFLDYFDALREKLLQHERDVKLEKSLKKKEAHWIKVFKTMYKKKAIPPSSIFKERFNYQNLNLVVASYIAWEHNKLKPSKNEPKMELLADWKQIYSNYKEVFVLRNKSPELFSKDVISITRLST